MMGVATGRRGFTRRKSIRVFPGVICFRGRGGMSGDVLSGRRRGRQVGVEWIHHVGFFFFCSGDYKDGKAVGNGAPQSIAIV